MRNVNGNGEKRLIKLLVAGNQMTTKEAAIKAVISQRVARRVLKRMYDDEKKIFIIDFRRDADRGPWMAVYRWGQGEDAVRPPRLTTNEKAERFRARLRKDLDKFDRLNDSRRTKLRVVRADPVAVGLFPWMYAKAKLEAGLMA